ncbi:hypothetical protein Tco_1295837 [Tanacetum coccineum]
MSDYLFDIYQYVESSKELWDSLEAKYTAKDASSKNFLVSNFINYKMTDSRPVMEQYNELLGILGRFTQYKMNINEAILVSYITDKLPPSWKYFKHTLKHQKEELTLVELGSHLLIKESLRVQDSDKQRSNNVAGPSVVNMVEHNNSSRYTDNSSKHKHHDNTSADPNKKAKPTCWKCDKTGSENIVFGSRSGGDLVVDHGLSQGFWGEVMLAACYLLNRDAIFDENRFSSVPRPSLRIPNGTKYIDGSVVPEEVLV